MKYVGEHASEKNEEVTDGIWKLNGLSFVTCTLAIKEN
jgi:hypothetical protein